jgi:hypothetical protein
VSPGSRATDTVDVFSSGSFGFGQRQPVETNFFPVAVEPSVSVFVVASCPIRGRLRFRSRRPLDVWGLVDADETIGSWRGGYSYRSAPCVCAPSSRSSSRGTFQRYESRPRLSSARLGPLPAYSWSWSVALSALLTSQSLLALACSISSRDPGGDWRAEPLRAATRGPRST